jgi:thioredoxin-related protein
MLHPVSRTLYPLRHAATAAFAFLALVLIALPASSASAAELIMYDKPGCVWCARWERDIGRRYASSELGRYAPLRRVDIHDQRRSGVALAEPVIYTPTFVLSEDGEEIGRITGYQGEDGFWGDLEELLRSDPR